MQDNLSQVLQGGAVQGVLDSMDQDKAWTCKKRIKTDRSCWMVRFESCLTAGGQSGGWDPLQSRRWAQHGTAVKGCERQQVDCNESQELFWSHPQDRRWTCIWGESNIWTQVTENSPSMPSSNCCKSLKSTLLSWSDGQVRTTWWIGSDHVILVESCRWTGDIRYMWQIHTDTG